MRAILFILLVLVILLYCDVTDAQRAAAAKKQAFSQSAKQKPKARAATAGKQAYSRSAGPLKRGESTNKAATPRRTVAPSLSGVSASGGNGGASASTTPRKRDPLPNGAVRRIKPPSKRKFPVGVSALERPTNLKPKPKTKPKQPLTVDPAVAAAYAKKKAEEAAAAKAAQTAAAVRSSANSGQDAAVAKDALAAAVTGSVQVAPDPTAASVLSENAQAPVDPNAPPLTLTDVQQAALDSIPVTTAATTSSAATTGAKGKGKGNAAYQAAVALQQELIAATAAVTAAKGKGDAAYAAAVARKQELVTKILAIQAANAKAKAASGNGNDNGKGGKGQGLALGLDALSTSSNSPLDANKVALDAIALAKSAPPTNIPENSVVVNVGIDGQVNTLATAQAEALAASLPAAPVVPADLLPNVLTPTNSGAKAIGKNSTKIKAMGGTGSIDSGGVSNTPALTVLPSTPTSQTSTAAVKVKGNASKGKGKGKGNAAYQAAVALQQELIAATAAVTAAKGKGDAAYAAAVARKQELVTKILAIQAANAKAKAAKN